MRAFGVEFAPEGIEAVLLLQAVHAGRPCGLLLQGQVHAFVAAVLLGVSWLDALDGDAEPEPPDGELGEVEEPVGAAEGHAIIGPDGERQAALLEELLEGRDGEVLPGRVERLAEQEEARGVVGDGERVAVAAVAELELAFEVGAPKV